MIKSDNIWKRFSQEIGFKLPKHLKENLYDIVIKYIQDQIKSIKSEKIEIDISRNKIENIKKINIANSILINWKKCIDICFETQPILKTISFLKPKFETIKTSEIEEYFYDWISTLQIEIVEKRIGGNLI